jgi:hypothetical protein
VACSATLPPLGDDARLRVGCGDHYAENLQGWRNASDEAFVRALLEGMSFVQRADEHWRSCRCESPSSVIPRRRRIERVGCESGTPRLDPAQTANIDR